MMQMESHANGENNDGWYVVRNISLVVNIFPYILHYDLQKSTEACGHV